MLARSRLDFALREATARSSFSYKNTLSTALATMLGRLRCLHRRRTQLKLQAEEAGLAFAFAVGVGRRRWLRDGAVWDIRRAAVDALLELAEKGDRTTTTAVVTQLQDRDHDVRRAAVAALPQLAEKGNQATIRNMAEISMRLRAPQANICRFDVHRC